jgi:hypothetical protein
MKQSLRLFSILILLVLAGSVSSTFAQSTRFAFVNKERTLIFIHEGTQRDTLFLPVEEKKFRAERLAVLGSSPDGKSLLVGGKIFYAALGSGFQAEVSGFFRIPIPPHGQQLDYTTLLSQGKILKQVDEMTTKILPLGTITPDGQRWYGIWMSAAPNNPSFKIYQGNFNENDNGTNVQVGVISGAAAFDAGYHMTNVTTTEDGNMAIFMVMDKLQSGGLERAQLIRWVPGNEVSLTDITGKINAIGPGPSADKAMAFAVRGVGPATSPKVQMAVVTETNDDVVTIYELQSLSNPSFNSSFIKGTINRSSLPNNLDFFTGYTGNADDVYSEAPQQGNGGDMMFSRDGNKLIFVTREFPENQTIRPQSSAIYQYDLTAGVASELWNDPTKEERQPIFVDGTGIIPVAEQKLEITPTEMKFQNVMIGSSKTLQLTIKNVGTIPATIKSVTLGPLSEYTITANSLGLSAPYTFTLAENASATFDIKFTPTIEGSTVSDVTVEWNGDSSRKVIMRGRGEANGAVSRDYTEVFTFGIAPNPVVANSVITLKGVETTDATLELVDATGRAVWSASSKLSAGSTSTYELNAQNIAAGSYFLIVRAADVQAVRQVVVTK